ncbi:MAG: PDC sensor domain-containing protein [Acidiferrobacterales bacterium]
MTTLQQTILEKKAALAERVSAPIASLADNISEVWPDADVIDQRLQKGLPSLPNCHLLYAWDVSGIELSSMVRASGPDPSWRGRDLSDRPYLKNHLPFKGVMLSSVYLSKYTYEYCLTALQAVSRDNRLLGFIAADFAVNDLLRDAQLDSPQKVHWQQFRGDPSVRGTVFMQTRTHSFFDEHVDEAIEGIAMLMREYGVFHSKIHFSSGRCSFWLIDDPYNYHLHGVDDVIDPEMRLAYPARPYPTAAKTREADVIRVLDQFKTLRFLDETIYLRSGSLNVMNDMVGLTFSCDGSHYMSVEEFLARDLGFWVGGQVTTGRAAAG